MAPSAPSARSRVLLAEDGDANRAEPAARARREGDVAVGHLDLTGLTAQLTYGLDDEEDPAHPGVARRQPAAVGVERQLAAPLQVALGDERAAFATLAEADTLEQQQHGDREAVVEHD